MYVCLFACLCYSCWLRVANRTRYVLGLWENRWSNFSEREITRFKFYKVEDLEQQFGEEKCPLTYYVLFPWELIFSHNKIQPKDWLAFSLSLFTIWIWAVMRYIYDTIFPRFCLWICDVKETWAICPEYFSVRTGSLDDHPRK